VLRLDDLFAIALLGLLLSAQIGRRIPKWEIQMESTTLSTQHGSMDRPGEKWSLIYFGRYAADV
jgi:hypothetical protein